MTSEEQATERALVIAERNWLLARGWKYIGLISFGAAARQRFAHPAAPKAQTDYTARDALAMTRADPLRFKASRYTPGPA